MVVASVLGGVLNTYQMGGRGGKERGGKGILVKVGSLVRILVQWVQFPTLMGQILGRWVQFPTLMGQILHRWVFEADVTRE